MAEKGRDSIDFGRDGIWALFRAWLAIPAAETITLAIIVSAYLVVRRRKDYSSRATA